MGQLRQSRQAGRFALAQDEDIYGELTLAGPRSSLHLYDRRAFQTHAAPHQYITGILHDLTKVSLVHCVTQQVPGHCARGTEEYYFAKSFPHYVIRGDSHLAPNEKTIAKIHFVVEDAATLFYDFDTFGIALDAKPFIEQITAANAKVASRPIHAGPAPWILYFTGRCDIFSAGTVIGRISASHCPRPTTFGGPTGVGLKNTIVLTIEFPEPILFEQSIQRMMTAGRFLEILLGRPQSYVGISLTTESGAHHSVHWSMQPKRKRLSNDPKPHPSDVLLDAVRQTDDFCRVFASWLDRDESWLSARMRFSKCFAKENSYGIDRLIAAANMFDILPTCSVPSDVPLSKELEAAKAASREAFRVLPQSPERDSILGALGRVGRANLKHKVRYRAANILKETARCFPDLTMVIDEAVNCRNFYVHGSDPSFDYNTHFDAVNFFTDTLEFVFAASDLVEAGWDVKAWSQTATTMSHPYSRYRISYAPRLQELKALLA